MNDESYCRCHVCGDVTDCSPCPGHQDETWCDTCGGPTEAPGTCEQCEEETQGNASPAGTRPGAAMTTPTTLTPYRDHVTQITVDGQTSWQGTVTWQGQTQHTTACYGSAWEAQDACYDWMNAQWAKEAAAITTVGNPSSPYGR